jgi:hypothetical protein
MYKVTYDNREYDFAKLPEATGVALIRRGLSHLMGSEASSKLQGKIEKAICTGADDADTEARTAKFEALSGAQKKEALKAFREANAEAVAGWLADIRADYEKAMTEGTLGVSVRGPTVDPLTTIVNRLAKAEVVNVLKASKTAIPKKAEDKISFPGGQAFTVAELVERRKAHAEHGPRLVKEAKTVLAAQERAAKKAAEQGLDDL